MRFASRFLYGILSIFVALMLAPSVHAQTTYSWTGAASGNWGTTGNWSPATVPGGNANDKAQFGNTARTSITLVAFGDMDVDSLIFLSGAPSYTITLSANSDSSLLNGIINNSAAQQKIILSTAASLNFVGGNAANSLITSAGSLEFDASLGNPTVTNQSGGSIFFANSTAIDGSAATIINAGNALVIVDESTVSIGSLSGAGNIEIFSGLTLGNLGRNDTISGVISDQDDSGALTKTGSGTLILSAANTYTGHTTVQSGTLQVDASLASATTLVDSNAAFASGGSIGDLLAQANSLIIPGNANANSKLSAGRLYCANSPVVRARIGNVGSATHGTYLALSQPLQSAFCPHLHFRFNSADVPLAVGQSYLAVLIQGSTDYTTSNLDFDFASFPGYPQATGTFFIANLGSVSAIYFQPTDLGNEIFKNGFE